MSGLPVNSSECSRPFPTHFFILNKYRSGGCVRYRTANRNASQLVQEGEPVVTTTEIAPEIYRLALFVPEINLEFSHFLVRDDEPLLFHA